MSDGSSGFHEKAFTRVNDEPDTIFYAGRQSDTLMDLGARTAVSALYRTVLPAGGVLLDLMTGGFSHLPDDIAFDRVIGIGIGRGALNANAMLAERIVQDLNTDPVLPFDDESLDAAMLCDGLAYLTAPVTLLSEVKRVLKPGAPLAVTFSDNFHQAKAVALWQALDAADRVRLVGILLTQAGFAEIDTGEVTPPEDLTAWQDTVHAVIGRTPVA